MAHGGDCGCAVMAAVYGRVLVVNKIEQFTQTILEKRHVTQSMRIAPDFIQDAHFDVERMANYIGNDLMVCLSAYVLGKDSTRFAAHYPRNAWQFFKQDYMPAWFKKMYPVKHTNIMANITEAIDQRVAVETGGNTVTFTTRIHTIDGVLPA